MRIVERLNPGPGIADFWQEFRRPNPYRWPILAGSALLTGSLLYLLSDHAVSFNWIVGGVLALLGGIALAAMIASRTKIHVPVLLVALAITGTVLYQFSQERWIKAPPPPDVTYITTFADGRSDAEIAASNAANQRAQEAWKAEQARREEEAKNAYRALGRATGLDVDAMERDIARQDREDAAVDAASRR